MEIWKKKRTNVSLFRNPILCGLIAPTGLEALLYCLMLLQGVDLLLNFGCGGLLFWGTSSADLNVWPLTVCWPQTSALTNCLSSEHFSLSGSLSRGLDSKLSSLLRFELQQISASVCESMQTVSHHPLKCVIHSKAQEHTMFNVSYLF